MSSGRWKIVRGEIESLIATYGKTKDGARRTEILTVDEEPEFSEEDFIVAEDCHVLLSTEGWVKRQKQIADPSKSRMREGDNVLTVVAGSTRATLAFFSSFGVCYTARFIDVPPSTGYGEPIQKLFKMKDGERIVAAISLDKRAIGDIALNPKKPDLCPPIHGFAATSNGFALRFGLEQFVEPSTRSGPSFSLVLLQATRSLMSKRSMVARRFWRYRPSVARWSVRRSKSTIFRVLAKVSCSSSWQRQTG